MPEPSVESTVGEHRSLIHGVDFSAARDAGRHAWIASGRVVDGGLRIERCLRAEGLPGSSRTRDGALSALVRFISGQPSAVFGLDFPFGLPSRCCGTDVWETLVRSFADRFGDAQGFREACWNAGSGREFRRLTDQERDTPFCAYNLRLYRQTYFGLRDVLRPLVERRAACILPMQEPEPGKASVVEICPASTLKKEALYRPYKGRTDDRRQARAAILQALHNKGLRMSQSVRSTVIEDPGGDALDSIIAAFTTARALSNDFHVREAGRSRYRLEGHVYA